MASRAVTLPRIPTSRHAVERFTQRLRRDLPLDTDADWVRAELELWAVLADAAFVESWPAWVKRQRPKVYRGHFETTDQHGRTVIFPVARNDQGENVTTVLVQGWDDDG